MKSNIAISATNLGKCYTVYKRPIDRLKQYLMRGKKTYFTPFWALQDVSFDIDHGETVGIIGSNGSGKSTLLQMICNVLKPTTGQIEIKGRVAALLELGAGFNPEFSGKENIWMNAAIMGLTAEQINERYNDIVEFAGIGNFIDNPVKTYSSGMYVRLAFATAINVSPDILIIDEALAVGDVRFQQKCMARIKKFCEEGTVIFVSHNTAAVTELCSRVIWIESGKVRMTGHPKLVIEKYLQYMYENDADSSLSRADDKPPEGGEWDLSDFKKVDDSIRQFGNQAATIKGVRVLSEGITNSIVYSGHPCEISLELLVSQDLKNPIVGYLLKDRMGREILGDNSSLTGQSLASFTGGHRYLITFRLGAWPNLLGDDYTLSVAIADGLIKEHTQLHWLHDVLVIKSVPARKPGGLLSIVETTVDVTVRK